ELVSPVGRHFVVPEADENHSFIQRRRVRGPRFVKFAAKLLEKLNLRLVWLHDCDPADFLVSCRSGGTGGGGAPGPAALVAESWVASRKIPAHHTSLTCSAVGRTCAPPTPCIPRMPPFAAIPSKTRSSKNFASA